MLQDMKSSLPLRCSRGYLRAAVGGRSGGGTATVTTSSARITISPRAPGGGAVRAQGQPVWALRELPLSPQAYPVRGGG